MDSSLSTSRQRAVFHLLNKKGRGLEIGPSHNPIAPKKDGFNVQILDHATAQDLRSKYIGHNVLIGNIEEVDFVWNGEDYIDLIGESHCFDWIIASHVIEHVPDLVRYLQQCEKLLKEDGIFSLVIPDRRYCFDYFMPSTTTGLFLDAYLQQRKKPSQGQIFDHFSNASKRNNNIAWGLDDKGGADELMHDISQALSYWDNALDTENYIDVHCWRFTPASFGLLISDLNNLGLISLEIKAEFATVGCEFYVSLGSVSEKKSKKIDRLISLREINSENIEANINVK
jgi:SAM-dependent methyltransferase